MGLFDGKRGITPEKVAQLAKSVVSEDDIVSIIRAAVDEAIGADEVAPSPQARKFLQDVLFPKDSSQFEDVKWKRVVFCTFKEYNEIQKLKRENAKLAKENEELTAKIAELDTESLDMEGLDFDI
jgi:hypothetical protein